MELTETEWIRKKAICPQETCDLVTLRVSFHGLSDRAVGWASSREICEWESAHETGELKSGRAWMHDTGVL